MMGSQCVVLRAVRNVMAEAVLAYCTPVTKHEAFWCVRNIRTACVLLEYASVMVRVVSMGAVAMWLSRVSVLRPPIDSFLLKCDVELHGSIAFATLPHRACEMIALGVCGSAFSLAQVQR